MVTLTTQGSSAARDAARMEERRIRALLGVADSDEYEFIWLDSTLGSSVGAEGTGGTGTLTAGLRHMIFASGADASSFKQLFMSNLGSRADVPTAAAANWAISCRMKIATTPDAQAIHQFGGGAIMGFRGGTSADNFIAWSSAASIDSGQAVDTDFHTHRLVRKSSLSTYYIDEVSKGTSANLKPAANTALVAEVYNQATAANQATHYSWVAALLPRAA